MVTNVRGYNLFPLHMLCFNCMLCASLSQPMDFRALVDKKIVYIVSGGCFVI